MRYITVFIGLILLISYFGKAQNSKPVFEKQIFYTKSNYYAPPNNINARSNVYISVQAKDSSDFNLVISDKSSNVNGTTDWSRVDEHKIVISNRNLNAFTTCMKKYIDWMAIAESENIKLTKQIAIFNSNEFSAMRITPSPIVNDNSMTQINNNYTKLIISVEDNKFVLTAYGTYTQEFYNNVTYQKYYNTIDVTMPFTLYKSEVQEIYPLISGNGLKNLKIEIAKKVAVWDQFK